MGRVSQIEFVGGGCMGGGLTFNRFQGVVQMSVSPGVL